ncbi:hypothetical protein D3C87_1981810 [compost metagenome]
MWPNGFEEWPVGDFLHPGVDWCSAVLGPVGTPAPTDHVGPQIFPFPMEEGELSSRSGVIALERLIAGIVE